MDAIFENYSVFLSENADVIGSPQTAYKLITDEGMYKSFMEALTDGLSDVQKDVVLRVADRMREDLLTESTNIPASGFANGWTVVQFPILVDIYAEPIISELMNVYSSDSPVLTIPRYYINAITKSYDGTSETVQRIPSNTEVIRPGLVTVSVSPGVKTNVFTVAGVSSDDLIMNRRYTTIVKVVIKETDDGGAETTREINVRIRPDSRAQLRETIKFTDGGGTEVVVTLYGSVTYDTGEVIYNAAFSGGTTGYTFECQSADFRLRFTPTHTMNGRTKVVIKNEGIDVTIDENEDFLIELTQEQLQDYKAIFKLDLVRILSQAIKRQILLNKDLDLAYALETAEGDIANNGASFNVDLANYDANGGTGNYTPANVLDVIKAVIPRVSTAVGVIRRNFNMYPSYLVTGIKTASLLRSLQSMMVSMPDNRGSLGWSGETAQFLKLKILESPAVGDSKIYLSTKAPSNALEKSTILDLIFKPLYVVTETTDGNSRQFVRARTMIEVVRTDGLAVINVDNIDNYIG